MATGDPTTTPTVTPPAAPAAPDNTPTPQPEPDEGALHSYSTGWGVDPEAVKWAAKTIWHDPIGSIKAIGSAQYDELKHAFTHPIETEATIRKGVDAALTPSPDAVKTAQAHLHAPGLVNKLVGGAEYLTSGVPMFGSSVAKAEEQGSKGNIPGMLGTTAAVVSQALLGGKKAGEKVSTETELGPVSAEAGKAPGELEPLNRPNAKKLQDLGYSNQAITNFNALEVDHIVKNNIQAPPVVDLTGMGAKEVMSAPYVHPPAEDVAATATDRGTSLEAEAKREADLPNGFKAVTRNTAEHNPFDYTHLDRQHEVSLVHPDGTMVGSIVLQADPENPSSATVAESHINPNLRGTGAGKQFYLSSIESAKKLGYATVQSDMDRSPSAEGVWKSLVKDGVAEFRDGRYIT